MRIRSAVTALALAVTGVVVTAAPASASVCNDNVWQTRDGSTGNTFTGSNVNIRNGPLTTCGINAVGQIGHNLRYDCFKFSSDGYSWSHIKNLTTGYSGWVRDTYLSGSGASLVCQ
jgi:uncharacterized protein YraI